MITTEEPLASAGRGLSGATAVPRQRALCAMPVAPESVPVLRRFARHLAGCWQLPEAVAEALSVVVTELVTNVLLHSGSPNVVLLLVLDGVAVTAEVRDGGRWKRRRTPRTERADADARCGRGLQLVEAYAAQCTVSAGRAGTRVSAVFPLAT
ncbi:hypothetical protein GCM10010193_45440 [Kitasatospora atroaurantiaca]|uniref:Histidine kinase-like protein n=1 Tax=Kitasatospora atroaurantiaca TaxID=285545 RepID=A0A561EZN6_9ACTN|nr:ATP-binding protein [Kitasatospora atroaurantiaca]TWE21074.1 histidine kinase-like protein [Kitasatospora atroaurantiaca]